MSFVESLKELRANEGKMPQPGEPKELAREDIHFASGALQPRFFEGTRADREEHIRGLMTAIRETPGHILEPIVVWWTGTRWVVIDGHHRMIAYQRLAADRDKPLKVPKVPVVIFKGTHQQAIREASRRNYRDKLNMTKDEKLERAWKMTVIDHPKPPTLSKADISSATGVSIPTISNMRKELRRITEETPEVNPVDLTWDEVKKGARKLQEYDARWLEKQAKKYADRLSKVFGTQLSKNPELAARAIELYSEKLPMRMIEYWREEVEAKVEEWGDEDF
jgi:ParB-like chromosome segregation protein Spo0J